MPADLFEAQGEQYYLNIILEVNSDVLYLHGIFFLSQGIRNKSLLSFKRSRAIVLTK